MDETDGLGAAKEFCVSEPLLEGSDDGSCAFSWETNPTCQFAWCGNNEQIGWIVDAGSKTIAERILHKVKLESI